MNGTKNSPDCNTASLLPQFAFDMSKEKLNRYSVVMLYTELEHRSLQLSRYLRFDKNYIDLYSWYFVHSFVTWFFKKNYIDKDFKCQVCVWWGVWVHISKTYQFLSASFRNLTNAINSTYYQAFTMRNVWESVVSEAWRGSPFILAGHTMQPDRILNRILIGYFFSGG